MIFNGLQCRRKIFIQTFFISWRVHWPYLVVQVYELITFVRRANENARNLISGIQFLIITILPNHYVHPGSHEMRTHRHRSVHSSFAVGSVVCWELFNLGVLSTAFVTVSLFIFLFCFLRFVDEFHIACSGLLAWISRLLWRITVLSRASGFGTSPES